MRTSVASIGLIAALPCLVLANAALADYETGAAAAAAGDFATAFKEWKPSAASGDPRAQYALGRLYYLGDGVARNDKEAVSWFRRAAEVGHPYAQSDLAYMYEKGRGVSRDGVEAVRWYEKAASQGATLAQFNLALLYIEGKIVDKDPAKAAPLLRQAAQHGHAGAQNQLGQMYLLGVGVERNYTWAYVWLSLSVVGIMDEKKRNGLWDLKMQAEKQLKPDELRLANEILLACVTKSKELCGTEVDKR